MEETNVWYKSESEFSEINDIEIKMKRIYWTCDIASDVYFRNIPSEIHDPISPPPLSDKFNTKI